jgi:hypothetical protein
VVMPTTAASSDLRIVEDERIRIEETRQNGQLRRVTVVHKSRNTPDYDIVVGGGDRNPSAGKSAAGQRVWSILNF